MDEIKPKGLRLAVVKSYSEADVEQVAQDAWTEAKRQMQAALDYRIKRLEDTLVETNKDFEVARARKNELELFRTFLRNGILYKTGDWNDGRP